MKTLIRNALLVTMNAQNEVIENGSIVIDGNKLAYVGPTEWTPPDPFDWTIEADRRIAMPGMVNAHCHSPANLVRGRMPSKPLEIWRAYYRAGYERRRFLCQRASWRHGNIEEWYNDRAGPFFRQPGVSLHGCRGGDPGHARSRVAPCYFAHTLRQKL